MLHAASARRERPCVRFDRAAIADTLAATKHNQSEAARRLGVSRVTLIDKMKPYNVR